MKIILDKSKYHIFGWYFDYSPQMIDFAKTIQEAFGWQAFSFCSEDNKKRWVFSDINILTTLTAMYPQCEVSDEVKIIAIRESNTFRNQQEMAMVVESIKNKKTTDFKVKGLKGEPYNYQNVGIEFLDASGGRAIIADQPGVGKSLQALGYAIYKNFARNLIVCPASVKFAWESEIKKWTNKTSIIIDGKTDLNEISFDTTFWIINYDILKKFYKELMKIRFDNLIGDEAHKIKNPTAQRTKAFRHISLNIPHITLLSGTPLLSRPIELFSLLNIVDPKSWPNYYDYARRYCNARQTRFGLDVSGVSNADELHGRVKKYFIRRMKEEVLSELPQKNRIPLPVELSPLELKEYITAENDLATYLLSVQGKTRSSVAKTLRAEKLAKLNVLRSIIAKGKVKTVTEIIDGIIESDEKVLVFSSFNEPLEMLSEEYKENAVKIVGDVAVGKRGEIVNSFQNDPNIKIFLGGYKSSGEGITLTKAQNVIFLDYAWNPSDHDQAEDRAHRPGSIAEYLNIYQIYAIDTIDEELEERLVKKRKIINRVIDGEIPVKEEDDIIEKVMNGIINRRSNMFN